jgi:hypothetical protein
LGLDPAGVLALELDFAGLDFEALAFETLAFDELAFDFSTLLALVRGVGFAPVATALGLSLCRTDALTSFSSAGRWTSDNFFM